jgi:hypothetical protein
VDEFPYEFVAVTLIPEAFTGEPDGRFMLSKPELARVAPEGRVPDETLNRNPAWYTRFWIIVFKSTECDPAPAETAPVTDPSALKAMLVPVEADSKNVGVGAVMPRNWERDTEDVFRLACLPLYESNL